MRETEIKKGIEDYLTYKANQGKLWWTRLNSGKAWMKYKEKLYLITLCPEGTPDLMVIKLWYPKGAPNKSECLVIFFEVKSKTGKLSEKQKEAHELLTQQGAAVFTVRSVDEVMNIIKEAE